MRKIRKIHGKLVCRTSGYHEVLRTWWLKVTSPLGGFAALRQVNCARQMGPKVFKIILQIHKRYSKILDSLLGKQSTVSISLGKQFTVSISLGKQSTVSISHLNLGYLQPRHAQIQQFQQSNLFKGVNKEIAMTSMTSFCWFYR